MIIGLCGYARSGKDSLGLLLVERHGFKRFAHADKVREYCYRINPIIIHLGRSMELRELVDSVGWEEAKHTCDMVRRLLQVVGNETRNVLGEDVWVNALWNDVTKAIGEGHKRIVITDCRYANEGDAVKKAGGDMLEISRPGFGPINDMERTLHCPKKFKAKLLANDGSKEQLLIKAVKELKIHA